MSLLDSINEANDIKKIPQKSYPMLAGEIRKFLVENVSKTGGHLASNLGTVELTIALHAVMDLPKDSIIWDVGHQSYTHKILTGRKDQFGTLREFGGLSGFPKRSESECDSFDTGHSSTSISAALGLATAEKLSGQDNKIVAVIGDGSFTNGMVWEALNNLSSLKRNFVIVLNDNNMSISENVGGMSNLLNKLRVGKKYNDLKIEVEKSLRKVPKFGDSLIRSIKRVKDNIKNLFIKPVIPFDEFGITYIGPLDGHDIDVLIKIFDDAFRIKHPVIIHVKTKKGVGYRYAEKDPSKFHGIGPFHVQTGEIKDPSVTTYSDVFSKKIIDLAAGDKDIVAITAAMRDGTGLSDFFEKYPERAFDVGIAEEHAVTFAAGLAAKGMKPYVAVYSSFFQRAYDQILHDVCLQNLPVRFMCDRSGLVGRDGETHQGVFDISFMTAMPNMTVIAPKDRYELEKALEFVNKYQGGPVCVRYSRGKAYEEEVCEEFEIGKCEIIERGKDIALISVGNIYEEVKKARDILKEDNIDASLINARFLKPLDIEFYRKLFSMYEDIVVVEEGIRHGGFGQQIEELACMDKNDCKVHVIAIDDRFVSQGDVASLRRMLGLDAESICLSVRKIIGR